MESTEWKTDGLIFCWSWYGLKETSLSVCQVMKPPWELTDTHCSEAAELCTAVVYYWQLQTHADAHTDTVGVLVSRGVTFVPASVCSHVSPEVVLVLSLHCCRHTHDEDPKVPLVCVCDHHPAFIPSVLWWPDQSCLSHPVWFCFCGPGTSSTPSSRRIKSTIVLHFGSQRKTVSFYSPQFMLLVHSHYSLKEKSLTSFEKPNRSFNNICGAKKYAT